MKKVISVIALVLIVASISVLFVACSDKDDSLKVNSYEIKESIVKVGDKHGTPTIKAYLSDGTDKTVANNLVYNEADLAALLLDEEDKYTKAGTYTVKVYILEEKEELYVGDWKITVKVVK